MEKSVHNCVDYEHDLHFYFLSNHDFKPITYGSN